MSWFPRQRAPGPLEMPCSRLAVNSMPIEQLGLQLGFGGIRKHSVVRPP